MRRKKKNTQTNVIILGLVYCAARFPHRRQRRRLTLDPPNFVLRLHTTNKRKNDEPNRFWKTILVEIVNCVRRKKTRQGGDGRQSADGGWKCRCPRTCVENTLFPFYPKWLLLLFYFFFIPAVWWRTQMWARVAYIRLCTYGTCK
jgi:hypothetical protein